MFFLNLSLGEFLGLLGVLSASITALYLLDRAKKKKLVSTLRFWADAGRVEEQRRRKHVREPWSLVLQLVSLLMLLLAIAQVQWGTREQQGRDHVLLLDSSSWMAQRVGKRILLDDAKRIARGYLSSLPARDRVMLVRIDNLSTPVTGFTDDRRQLLTAIAGTQASYSALDLKQAFDAASRWLHRLARSTGEIVYIGAEHVISRDSPGSVAKNVRVLPVMGPSEDIGIRHIAVKRAEDEPELWQAYVAIRNYGISRKTVTIRARFADSHFRRGELLLLPPRSRVSNTASPQVARERSPRTSSPAMAFRLTTTRKFVCLNPISCA